MMQKEQVKKLFQTISSLKDTALVVYLCLLTVAFSSAGVGQKSNESVPYEGWGRMTDNLSIAVAKFVCTEELYLTLSQKNHEISVNFGQLVSRVSKSVSTEVSCLKAQDRRYVRLTIGSFLPRNSFPHAESKDGFGISLGLVNLQTSVGVEGKYIRSSHKVTGVPFIQEGSRADYTSVDLDFKFHLSRGRVKPFLLIGVCWVDFAAKDALNIYDVLVGDASYSGKGVNYGGGVDFYLNRNLLLSFTVVHRSIRFSPDIMVFDSREERTIGDKLSGSSLSLQVGINLVF